MTDDIQDLDDQKQEYFAKGGKIKRVPAKQSCRNRKQLSPQHIRRRLPAGYEHEPAQRWEKLLIRMGLPGLDPGAVKANKGFRHEPHQVWGALAMAHLPDEVEALLIYMATGDRRSRAVVYAKILWVLMYWAETERWDCRKPGTLDNMSQLLIFDVADPHRYSNLSHRRWATLLGLRDHRDWPRRWYARYMRARYLVAGWANEGIEVLQKRMGKC